MENTMSVASSGPSRLCHKEILKIAQCSLKYKDLTEQSEVGSGMKQELQAYAKGTDHSLSIIYVTMDVGMWLCLYMQQLFGILLK
ncbi:hypothetical protein E4T56_gene18788 [Termitomyces sp. T112]|nr:hypothetical protein E4T56_gene18788 [Termitomyces sp. T112]